MSDAIVRASPALAAALLLLGWPGFMHRAEAQPSQGTYPAKAPLKIPPSFDKPTRVTLDFYAMNLGKVDQINETFDIAGLLTTTWKDERLAFAPRPGEKLRQLAPEQIWMPELTILNAPNPPRKTLIQLSATPDGEVKCIEFVAMTVSAGFDLHKFPFDTQTAIIIWEPLSSEVQPLELVASPLKKRFSKEDFVTLSEWDIQDGYAEVKQLNAEEGDISLAPNITFKMPIKRNSTYYIYKVFFPLLLITFISWTAFWLNPTTSFAPQINAGIISILVAITFNITITSVLPRVPYATALDGYLGTCFLFFFLSVGAVVGMQVFITNQKTETAMRFCRACRWIIPLLFIIVQVISLRWFGVL